MDRSKISTTVVVPTFNRSALIGETLLAVLQQTLSPQEVIVVDDGSTDGTEMVVRQFPVRYIRQENAGQNAARATGAKIATSDWIAFCDDDDVWRPTFLETMADQMPQGALFGFANFVPIENGIWGSHDKFSEAPDGFFDTPDQPLYPKLIEWVPILPSASIIKLDHLRAIGGIDLRYGRSNCQDFELALRCTERAPVAIVHDVLVGIRRHADQQTRNRLNMALGRVHALRWSRDHHLSAQDHADILDRKIAASTIDALNEAFVQGRLDLVRDLAHTVPTHLQTPKLRLKHALAQTRIPGNVISAIFGR